MKEEQKNKIIEIMCICAIILCVGLALKWVIPALGAAVGVTTSIISGGLISSTFSSWVIPTASVGLAIGGGATGIYVIHKAVINIKKNPYEWTLPILAIISGLVIDTCKELFTENPIVRVIYGATVTGLFLLGGILWRQKKIKLKAISSKFIAVIIFLLPPFLIYLRYSLVNKKNFFEAYKDIPPHILWSILLLLIFLVMIAFLSWIFKDDDEQ